MPQTVAILGGGVAGLSAAHELAERGFQVRVFERKAVMDYLGCPLPRDGATAAFAVDGFSYVVSIAMIVMLRPVARSDAR